MVIIIIIPIVHGETLKCELKKNQSVNLIFHHISLEGDVFFFILFSNTTKSYIYKYALRSIAVVVTEVMILKMMYTILSVSRGD